MGVSLSQAQIDFLREPVYAHVATLMKDGSPQVTPVWVDTDGTDILLNTATGRLKTRNIERDGRVALSIMGLGHAYRCLWVRGRVTEVTPRHRAHRRAVAQVHGQPVYQGYREGETRLTVRIEPLTVAERGLG